MKRRLDERRLSKVVIEASIPRRESRRPEAADRAAARPWRPSRVARESPARTARRRARGAPAEARVKPLLAPARCVQGSAFPPWSGGPTAGGGP